MKLKDLALYGCLAVSTPFLSGCSPSGDFNPAIKSELIGSGKNSFVYKGEVKPGAIRVNDTYYLIYPTGDDVNEFNGRNILGVGVRRVNYNLRTILNPEVLAFIERRVGSDALKDYTLKRLSGNTSSPNFKRHLEAHFRMFGKRENGPCFVAGPEVDGKRDVVEFSLSN